MNRTSLHISAMVIALSGLSACAAIQESQMLNPDTWNLGTSASSNTEAELGLGELAKGDAFKAQGHFEKALKANPNDVHALFGLAVLYQNNGQESRAAQLYQQILAISPAPTEEILIWAGKQAHPVVDVAEVNIQLLGSGNMAPLPGTPMQGAPMQATAQPAAPSQLYVQPRYPNQMSQPQPAAQVEPMFKSEDLNIVARFKTMRTLLDQGLITQDEFLARRKINAGALLPMTSAPAATGLDRPVPAVEQISNRLRAIGRALEMRALSPGQHMAERTMILDALMPASPASVANPAPPPKGLMAAADAVRRLEMLKEVDLITSDEYAKERAAIEGSMQPAAQAPMSGAPAKTSGAAGQASLSGFQPAVHLASYRQKKAAQRGWAQLKRQFGQLLGSLTPNIEKVDLGGSKGMFYRLKAGPLPSNGAAQDICRKLKAKRQFCEPSTINFG